MVLSASNVILPKKDESVLEIAVRFQGQFISVGL